MNIYVLVQIVEIVLNVIVWGGRMKTSKIRITKDGENRITLLKSEGEKFIQKEVQVYESHKKLKPTEENKNGNEKRRM
jgi:hypothetical protein|tara:strand:+ start:6842 stop:7075 length:234 start_codon:yes stop_codon:yes gene_type:complete